jgi:hypothetical protein
MLPVLLVLAVNSCDKLDVVGTESAKSFNKVLQEIPDAVTPDEMNGGWSLAAPDDAVRFIWSKNYAESPLHDIMLEFDAAPFIAAGLNPEKLPDNFAFYDNMIMVGTKLGQEQLKYSGQATPLASYEQIVKLKRSSIGYHGALDHYGLDTAKMKGWMLGKVTVDDANGKHIQVDKILKPFNLL